MDTTASRSSSSTVIEGASSLVVIGLGAMGGSVALGFGARSPGIPVFGIEIDDENRALALQAGVRMVDRLSDEAPDVSSIV